MIERREDEKGRRECGREAKGGRGRLRKEKGRGWDEAAKVNGFIREKMGV